MNKCNHCNMEWSGNSAVSSQLTECPFCKKSLAEKKDKWRLFDNTKDLLVHIAAEYGHDAVFSGKFFTDHADPMLPQWQKNLVKQAFDCGAVKILQNSMKAEQTEKERAVKLAVRKLVDTYRSAKEDTEQIVWEFTNALGWGLDEPSKNSSNVDTSANPPPPPPPTGNIGKLMTRAWQFAEDGDWSDAADYFNRVLDDSTSYAPAFLGLLCVDLKLKSENELTNLKTPDVITSHKHYKRVVIDPAVKFRLDGYIKNINDRIKAERLAAERAEAERKRREKVYNAYQTACRFMNNAKSPRDYDFAISEFNKIDTNYSDILHNIKKNITKCNEAVIALRERTEKTYDNACGLMNNAKTPDDYSKAITVFKNISSFYSDINSKIKTKIVECKRVREQLILHKRRVQDVFDRTCKIMDNAQSLDDYRNVITNFCNIHSPYQDINNRIQEKIAECENKIADIESRLEREKQEKEQKEREERTPITAAAAYYKPLSGNFPYSSLANAMNMINKRIGEQHERAREWLESQPPFMSDEEFDKLCQRRKEEEEQREKEQKIKLKQEQEKRLVSVEKAKRDFDLSKVKIGDVIPFGKYFWQVLDIQNGLALIITEYIFEIRQFHNESSFFPDEAWAQSELRGYLNGEFYSEFDSNEKVKITPVMNKNHTIEAIEGYTSNGYEYFPVEDTADSIFLLSLDEVAKYFGNSRVDLKEYRCIDDENNSKRISCFLGEPIRWWLRTPGRGESSSNVIFVDSDGMVNNSGTRALACNVLYGRVGENGVRPALWLNI